MADRRSIIVEQSYVIAAEPEAVFDALTDQKVLSECLTPLQRLRIASGSGGRIGFRDPELGPAIGRIGEHDRGVRLTWRMVQNWPSVLSFDFFSEGGGCRVDVIQSGFGALRGARRDIDEVFADRWESWMNAIKERLEA
jgi:uncharacterized protein YndB with AHSA1/START domain